MIKYTFLILLISISLISCSQNAELDSVSKALEIHKKVLTIDSHTDTPLRLYKRDFDIGIRNERNKGKIDLPKKKKVPTATLR